MVDETDPELDAASRRQDATDAARFRSDAAELRQEAAHDRDEATKFRRMGLGAEADRQTASAEDLEKDATDFEHRAQLLDDAIKHRTSAGHGLEIAAKAGAEATVAHSKATEIDARLVKAGLDDDTYVQLTGDAAAAKAREAAMRDLADAHTSAAATEITLVAVGEEVEAREGLAGRNVEVIEGMPPIVDPWAPQPAGETDAVDP
jgi:hypothetical protein